MKARNVPDLVRELRRRLDLTQEQFAQRVGVTYSTVNHWENGKRAPQPFLLKRLRELDAEVHAGDAGSDEGAARMSALGPGEARRDAASAGRTPANGAREAIQEMVSRIVERFRPDTIILFGSHARGQARWDSDVDLLVVMDVPGSKREAQLSVRRALRDIRVPKDVIVTTPEDFAWRQRIVGTIERLASREGMILYARG